MIVYLGGPINQATDAEANDWRTEAKALLAEKGAAWIDPMVRDYRGAEDQNVAEIVEGDKADLAECDAVIAYCPKPSVGTSMEILWSWERGLRVIVVAPDGAPVSPWLRYHSEIVAATVAAGIAHAVGDHALLRQSEHAAGA